jgi:hypothetical protein
MVADLRYRGDARGGVLEGVLDFFQLRVAALHAEQPHNRREAVLDAVARQHGLVFEGLLEVRISTFPLDGDAKQPREAGKEVRIREIELAGVGTVYFEDAERQMAFAAPRDQNVDRPLDPVIRLCWATGCSPFLLQQRDSPTSSPAVGIKAGALASKAKPGLLVGTLWVGNASFYGWGWFSVRSNASAIAKAGASLSIVVFATPSAANTARQFEVSREIRSTTARAASAERPKSAQRLRQLAMLG